MACRAGILIHLSTTVASVEIPSQLGHDCTIYKSAKIVIGQVFTSDQVYHLRVVRLDHPRTVNLARNKIEKINIKRINGQLTMLVHCKQIYKQQLQT